MRTEVIPRTPGTESAHAHRCLPATSRPALPKFPLRMRGVRWAGSARRGLQKKENMADERKAVEVVVKGENKKMDTEEDGCK